MEERPNNIPSTVDYDEIPIKVSSNRIYYEAVDENPGGNVPVERKEIKEKKTGTKLEEDINRNSKDTEKKNRRKRRKRKASKTYSHVGSRVMNWRKPVSKKMNNSRDIEEEEEEENEKTPTKRKCKRIRGGQTDRDELKEERRFKNRQQKNVEDGSRITKRKKKRKRNRGNSPNSGTKEVSTLTPPNRKRIHRRHSSAQPGSDSQKATVNNDNNISKKTPEKNVTKIKKRKTPDRYRNVQSRLMDWRKFPKKGNIEKKSIVGKSNSKSPRNDKLSPIQLRKGENKRRHSIATFGKKSRSRSSPPQNKTNKKQSPPSHSVKKRRKVKPNIFGSKRTFKHIDRRRRVVFNTKRNDLVEVKRVDEIRIPRFSGERFILHDSTEQDEEGYQFILPFDDSKLGFFTHGGDNSTNERKDGILDMTSIESSVFLKFSETQLLSSKISTSSIQLWKLWGNQRRNIRIDYCLEKKFSVDPSGVSSLLGTVTAMCKIDDQYFAASFGLLGDIFVFDTKSTSQQNDQVKYILPFRKLEEQHKTIVNSMIYLSRRRTRRTKDPITFLDTPILIAGGGINDEDPSNCPSNLSFFELLLRLDEDEEQYIKNNNNNIREEEHEGEEEEEVKLSRKVHQYYIDRIEDLMESPDRSCFGKLKGSKGSINSLRSILLDDGKKRNFVSCSDTGMVCIWEIKWSDLEETYYGKLQHVIRCKGAFSNVLSLLVFSKDYIILGMGNCELHIWELYSASSGDDGRFGNKSKLIRKLRQPNNKPVKCLEWMEDIHSTNNNNNKSFVQNHMFVSGSYQCLTIWSFTEDNVVMKDLNERILFLLDEISSSGDDDEGFNTDFQIRIMYTTIPIFVHKFMLSL